MESMERLQKICLEKKLSFEESDSSASIYDCIINGSKIQCKTISRKEGDLYKMAMCKSGKIIGKQEMPYHETDDFSFVIMEIVDFPNYFYIVPKSRLIEEGVFTSDLNFGIISINLPPPDYPNNPKFSKYVWLFDYLNRFDLLATPV